ncbi:Holliday junction branch migration DNA helicase RuvB [candidate division WOR-3 bacterium]|uniref:Holliday junction branch migration complex subunit RuvB n=1 Tax=candidate division WOR-3 bacterium TaxID=2052148 RepID=A0A660SGY7_UNCW3|nr:MAG: Holliday junction branch migration DNA helicase RuvB [candidate division WOR-3 bacterium]
MADITQPGRIAGEEDIERTLRPRTLDEFIGQKRLKENLAIFIQAAKKRNEPIDHILFYGPPGLGKTTLAHIIANELETGIEVTTGPVLERPADLGGILSKLETGQVLFIDEIHRLQRNVEEHLYHAMESFKLSIILDHGVGARTLDLTLAHFTLIGATTRYGLLTAPLRSRFGITMRIDYYPPEELTEIVKRSARILNIGIDDDGAAEIGRRARGTPRVANRLLRRVRDFAEVEGSDRITLKIARFALERLQVDPAGLDEIDKRILTTIVEKFNGGPVGLKSIAVAVGEDPQTIEEVYEPFLIMQGFIKRTPRGRKATDLAFRHLGIDRDLLF